MKIVEAGLKDLLIVKHDIFKDRRGFFVKTYNEDIFKELGIIIEIKERYFSKSNINVIRGMHFQSPPVDHIKLVSVINGKILDVVLDIRKSSSTYGKFFSTVIDGSDAITLYISKGFAHGFLALENNTIVEYNQTSCYSPKNDSGIRYDSFGFDWNVSSPIVSDRDNSFISLKEFQSPF